jgi:hypothetical protein
MRAKNEASARASKRRGALSEKTGNVIAHNHEVTAVHDELSLNRALATLRDLDAVGLRETWQRLLGTPPPPLKSRAVLRMELAWALQARLFGDLDSRTRQALAALASTPQVKDKPRGSRHSPGTVIVREWHGREYRVEVTADGYLFEGKPYRSLTAIAHRIAGVRWSGPRFFNLKKPTTSGARR